MANKVRFGLDNVHYALLNEDDGTYGDVKPIPGAVSLAASAQGSSSTFNADNGAYAVFNSNGGYTGTITFAELADAVAADLLDERKDKNGGMYEVTEAVPKPFALIFEVEGDAHPRRTVFYNCKVSRPDINANTTGGDSTDPDTVTLNFTAIPLKMTVGAEKLSVVKYTIEKSADNGTAFDAMTTAVHKPEAAA